MIRHIMRKAALLLTVGMATTLMAQTDDEKPVLADLSTLPADSVVEPPHAYNVYVDTRSYEDYIYIRWAPDEYVPWRTLNYWGYDVVRVWQDKDVITALRCISLPSSSISPAPTPPESKNSLFP